jgi:hypothetical protein
MTIDSSEISVVMQGLVYPDITQRCIEAMRRVLPHAEIILSTWKDAKLEGILVDKVVLNDDPGSRPLLLESERQNNMLRMIVSTQNGIKAATRKYCLRYRTDLEIKHDKFLAHFGKFPQRSEKWKILKERVLVNYATHPMMRCFHPTDITGFGLTEDMLKIWDIPLPSEDDLHYFLNHPLPLYFQCPPADKLVPRIGAEMWVWSSFLKKYEDRFGTVDFRHNWDGTPENIELTELTIANNLQVLSRDDFDFTPLAHPYLLGEMARYTWIDEKLWYYYVQKHCMPAVPLWDWRYYVYFPLTLLRYQCKYNPILHEGLRSLRKFRFKRAFDIFKRQNYRYILETHPE